MIFASNAVKVKGITVRFCAILSDILEVKPEVFFAFFPRIFDHAVQPSLVEITEVCIRRCIKVGVYLGIFGDK